MMPGESGFGLLQRLQSTPGLQGPAKVVVLSAGLNASVRSQLEPFNAWRLLSKPVSVSLLEACVTEALSDISASPVAGPGTAADSAHGGPIDTVDADGETAPDADQAQAIEDYFEGDAELFATYREACLAQFPADVLEGETASHGGDMPVLRRVAHSLKTVLLTLGYPAWSDLARSIEAQAEAGDAGAAREAWARLVAHLQSLQPSP
jgi:HPt (histidine-containing phosphotransfer) domain-containing protein